MCVCVCMGVYVCVWVRMCVCACVGVHEYLKVQMKLKGVFHDSVLLDDAYEYLASLSF